MQKIPFKKIIPHIVVLLCFVIVSLAYFSPVLSGKKISQSDIMHYIGMAQQQKDFKAETGTETYWTNSAFGGMPTYQLGAKYPHNYIKKLDLALRFLPRPADYLFLYFLGFYILLLSLKVDHLLAGVGALAFGFSTYLIIILGVGHNAKAHAIAYMPLVLSGIILTFKKKYVLGFILTVIALGLELVANHFQMTYYLLLLVIVLGVVYLVDAIIKGSHKEFSKSVGLLTIAALVAVGLNATNIMATQEYVKSSTRGGSELTIKPDGSKKEKNKGLDPKYITEYSYGKLESFNLLIPKFMGGGSTENIGKESATYEAYKNYLKNTYGEQITPQIANTEAKNLSENAPTYWGDQTIIEAPAYVGAVIIFLFFIGLFLVEGKLKWWLLAGTLLSLFLSFGKNMAWLTNFFIDYVPLYNKFRAVSSIQVILELCIPVLGILGLSKLFDKSIIDKEKINALKYSVIILGGLTIFFLLFKSSLEMIGLDFFSSNDKDFPRQLTDALIEDRKSLFVKDTFRALILILLSAGVIFAFLKNKISKNIAVVIFAGLILFDLISVNWNYVNNDDFVSAIKVDRPYSPNRADQEIMKDKSHFRVFDMQSRAPAKASFYHNSLTGYHAAKLKHMDDLLNFHVYKNNINVLNMLNTKYIIAEDKDGVFNYVNPDANGNAWFVSNIKTVDSANEEIQILDSLDTKTSAVIRKDIVPKDFITNKQVDSTASISLKEVKPNYLKYQSSNENDGFAVFSEIYYKPGWNAYINGELKEHLRVNYALRGMEIPKGNHTIEFKFEPKVIQTGSTITFITSVLVIGLILIACFFYYKGKDLSNLI